MSRKPWKKIATLEDFHAENPLPETPGVYFFLDQNEEILYIGKATVLADRVKSYFKGDLLETRGPKLHVMHGKISFIAWIPLDSVLEALLLESQLIRHFQPPYNTASKDDKSYSFIVLTKEAYPRILLVRERDLEQGKYDFPIARQFGPYTQGSAPKVALKILRRLFPFRDKCTPFEETTPQKEKRREKDMEEAKKGTPCFNAQIGLCPGVCAGWIDAKEYRKQVKRIEQFLSGEKPALIREIERDMHAAAKVLEFEKAEKLKQLLFNLQHIQDVALMRLDREEESAARLEAYDVAHLQGDAAVGVMTVVQHSIAKKSEYRLFRLRGNHKGNDLTALEEILTRRFAHTEWVFPELIIVDGALLQSDVALRILKKRGLTIPVVGVVKNKKHQPERIIGPRGLVRRFEKDILLANAEAHRFAIGFHRKRKRKEFLPESA